MAGMTGFRVLLCAAIAVVWALGAQALRAEPLRFITNVNSHPHNDKAPGFSIEVVRDVFAAMGRDVSFEFIPPSRAWVMIVRGERDGISDALRTGARERICLFPDEPQTRDRSVFFVRTADIRKLKFSSFDDLVGHDVATNKSFLPDSAEYPSLPPELSEFLREHHNLVETNGDAEGLRMLAAGRVDYAAMNVHLGMGEIRLLGLSGKIEPLLSRSVMEQDITTCFAKGRVSPALVDAFSRALRQFKQTDAFRVIQQKYGSDLLGRG
jgi:polar amino acid transport system substrate-binding protein